jgi:hypothetical protein
VSETLGAAPEHLPTTVRMTSDIVSPRKRDEKPAQLSPEQAAAAAVVAEAKARGLALTGPDGLLKLFTKNVLETALNEEMTEHLGHEKTRRIGTRIDQRAKRQSAKDRDLGYRR